MVNLLTSAGNASGVIGVGCSCSQLGDENIDILCNMSKGLMHYILEGLSFYIIHCISHRTGKTSYRFQQNWNSKLTMAVKKFQQNVDNLMNFSICYSCGDFTCDKNTNTKCWINCITLHISATSCSNSTPFFLSMVSRLGHTASRRTSEMFGLMGPQWLKLGRPYSGTMQDDCFSDFLVTRDSVCQWFSFHFVTRENHW